MPQAAQPQQNSLVMPNMLENGLQFGSNSEFVLQWQCSLFQFFSSAVISS